MRKFVPIFAAAAFMVLASDRPVTAQNVVDEDVDILDVDTNSDVVGLPDGLPPPRWYLRSLNGTLHAKGPINLPPDPFQPCHAFINQWNKVVDDTNHSDIWRFNRFTKILRKFEQHACRVDITRLADDAPEVDALVITPSD